MDNSYELVYYLLTKKARRILKVKEEMSNNIKYYNKNFDKYIKESINADMSLLYNEFEKHLKKNASILDLGCGSGVLCIGAALLGAQYCAGY